MPKQKSATLPALESTGVLDDLRRIVRVLRESSRQAEQRLGVSGAQLFVLRALADASADASETRGFARAANKALSLNELAARTRTHQSTVSVVVKRLVEGGLLTRVSSATDGRRVEIALTKQGRALVERAPLAAQDRLIEGIERLPPTQRRRLASSLRSLVVAMQLDERAPAMFFEDEAPAANVRPRAELRVSSDKPRKKSVRRVRL